MIPDLATFPPVQEELGGVWYFKGPKGEYVPAPTVKPALKLQDETARDMFGRAVALSKSLHEFKAWAFETVDAYVSILADQFSTKVRGEKGNMTLYSFNGLVRVTVQTADRLAFGPEIQIAKQLIVDELVPEWAAGSNVNLVALVQNAFRTDNEGQLSRYAIIGLRKLEVDDDRWRQAMRAIEESERVLSTARYVRCHYRAGWKADGTWLPVSLNIATV